MQALSYWRTAGLVLSCLVSVSSTSPEVIYLATANCEVSWISVDTNFEALSTRKISAFDNAASSFFTELLQAEEQTGQLPEQDVLVLTVNVMDQTLDVTDADNSTQTHVLLASSVRLTYIGSEQLSSLAPVLNKIMLADVLEQRLQDINLLDSDAESFAISCKDPGQSGSKNLFEVEELRDNSKSGADKGLIVACTFLSIALVIVSGVLIWSAGGFDELKARYANRISSKTSDEDDGDNDDTTNASGIIGADPKYNSENMPPGLRLSPNRGVYRADDDSQLLSPMSQVTNTTTVTETSRKPLGIVSMRKLNRFLTPDRRAKEAKNKLQIDKMSYT